MDPITLMAGVSLAGSVASGVMGAVSAKTKANAEATMAIRQGKAQAQQYEASANLSEYQSKVAEQNAQIAKENAQYELDAGGVAAENALLKTGLMIASQKAGYAGAGIDVGSGTTKAVAASTRMMGDLDVMTIINNANRKAFGYQIDAYNFMNDATLKMTAAGYSRQAAGIAKESGAIAGDLAQTTGNIAAMSAVVSGASSVSDKWISFYDKGMFKT